MNNGHSLLASARNRLAQAGFSLALVGLSLAYAASAQAQPIWTNGTTARSDSALLPSSHGDQLTTIECFRSKSISIQSVRSLPERASSSQTIRMSSLPSSPHHCSGGLHRFKR